MEAVCTSETSATLSPSIRCKDPTAEATSGLNHHERIK
jgi:hypothetical protein